MDDKDFWKGAAAFWKKRTGEVAAERDALQGQVHMLMAAFTDIIHYSETRGWESFKETVDLARAAGEE